MIEGNETAHLGTISGPKPHAKTIGNYLMFSILHALERAAQLDLISDYARLPDKGGKPDFGVNLDEDRDTFLVTYGDFKVEIEAKNRGRSPKKGKIWDGYPAFNRLDYDEVHDKITGKNWSVAPDYQILVVSELSPDIFTEPALGLIEQYFGPNIVEVGYQVLKEFDPLATQQIFEQLLTILAWIDQERNRKGGKP